MEEEAATAPATCLLPDSHSLRQVKEKQDREQRGGDAIAFGYTA